MAGELHEISAAIGGLRELVGIMHEGQKDLKLQVTNMTEKIADVQSDLSEVKASVAVVVTEQNGLKDRVIRLENSYDGLKLSRWKLYGSGTGLAIGGGTVGPYVHKLIAWLMSTPI